MEGESVTFNCSADGIPLPSIIWRKNRQLLILDPDRTKVVITVSDGFRSLDNSNMTQTESILTINPLIEADQGLYSCLADNQVGNPGVMETPYNLTIEKGLRLIYYVCITLYGLDSIFLSVLVSTDPPNPCDINPCYNGGMCYHVQDVFQCKCHEEYTGSFCQTSKY